MINRSSSPLYKPSNATNYPPRLLNLEVEVGIIEVEVEQKKKKKKRGMQGLHYLRGLQVPNF